jgi:hypothetical protein
VEVRTSLAGSHDNDSVTGRDPSEVALPPDLVWTSDPPSARFVRSRAPGGRDAETEFVQDLFSDRTIQHDDDEVRPNGTLLVAWHSDDGYRVFHIIRRATVEVRGGEVSVQTADGRSLSVEDFLAER